jgi:RNA polymerase sigma-70 factor (ECF subfamily)
MTAPNFDLWLSSHFRSESDHGQITLGSRRARPEAGESRDSAPVHKDDVELIAAIKNGDAERFAAWYDGLYNDAWSFARRFSNDGDEAGDVVQDVFLSIWRRRESWEVRGSARAYVLGAIRRRAMSTLRHERVVKDAAERTGAGEDGDARLGMGEEARSPDAGVAEHTLHDAMRRQIALLPLKQRTALALRWEHELSNVEIADILGVGEAAVSRLLARATATLRASWDAHFG